MVAQRLLDHEVGLPLLLCVRRRRLRDEVRRLLLLVARGDDDILLLEEPTSVEVEGHRERRHWHQDPEGDSEPPPSLAGMENHDFGMVWTGLDGARAERKRSGAVRCERRRSPA